MLHPRSPGVAGLVLMLVALPVVAMDLQFAAMPDIARDMEASVAAVQGTLSAFAGVFGVLQLAYGPVADRLGRKPLVVGGMLLFGLASIGAVLADTIAMLTAMRVLQAVGACAGPVLGRAVIRDIHGGQGAARVLGYVMGTFGILAIAGPLLGGVLVDAFDWRASYLVMAIFGFVAAALCWVLLPETRPEDAPGSPVRRSNPRTLIRTYATLLGTRQILVFVATGGLMQGAFFAWLSGSSFVIMKVFGYSGTAYGLILPLTVGGFIAASFLAGKLAGRLGFHRVVVPGVLLRHDLEPDRRRRDGALSGACGRGLGARRLLPVSRDHGLGAADRARLRRHGAADVGLDYGVRGSVGADLFDQRAGDNGGGEVLRRPVAVRLGGDGAAPGDQDRRADIVVEDAGDAVDAGQAEQHRPPAPARQLAPDGDHRIDAGAQGPAAVDHVDAPPGSGPGDTEGGKRVGKPSDVAPQQIGMGVLGDALVAPDRVHAERATPVEEGRHRGRTVATLVMRRTRHIPSPAVPGRIWSSCDRLMVVRTRPGLLRRNSVTESPRAAN
ncbi:MAG: multidrug effflux MFS transporter [Alphaproteobacteria bacterium]